jgi:DNA invertase Pin-like site-specific DNA recombinase
MTKTALIYVRQSKESETSASPATQEAACRHLPAVAACDHVIVYSDLGISGGKPPEKRPGFLALRERIDKDRQPVVVATYNQDRISRDNVDSLQFYAFVEQRAWVDLVMVDGHFERSPSGEFTWAIMAATAAHLRRITAMKIKAAYVDLNKQGIPTGMATYGYKYVNNTRASGALQPDPEQAPVVRRIFEMYADDSNTRTIAQTLTDEGIRANSKRGWLPDTIGSMLGNITYTARTYSESRRDKTGKIIPATWPAIIDDGLFQRVQDRMKRLTPTFGLKSTRTKDKDRDPAKPKRQQVPKSARAMTFRGLLWCSECDRKFVAQYSNDTVRYICGSRETTEPCDHALHSIREETLLPWVDDLIAGFELGRMGGMRFGKKPLIAKETAAGAIQNLDARMKREDTKFDLGRVTEDEYRSNLETLRRQRKTYEAQLSDDPKPQELEGVAAKWKSADPAMRHELLSALFEKLHVKNRRIIGYTPRADRGNRVALLIGTALDYRDEGPGAASLTSGRVERRGRDLNSRWASDP